MFIAFFESFKYMGHLWPIALLRIYMGVFFLQTGIHHIQEGVLRNPVFDASLQRWLNNNHQDQKILLLFQGWLANHWQIVSQVGVIALVVVGVCYVLGFMVRPAALIAVALSFNFMVTADAEVIWINKIFIALNAALFFVAAGRCFGFDYYFYKRVRGVWW
jgi:thiosulfate dehydrogenase [quinone] large subunit